MQTNYPGLPVRLNGTDYIMPSLSLRQFQDNYDLLTQSVVIDTTSRESVQAAFASYIPIIRMALNRNYQDITEDQLYDWLDLNNFREVMRAIQGASGMKPATGEEAPAAK